MSVGVKRIRPPGKTDITAFMRMLFLRTEQDLINEINRKRRAGLVEYAEAASLERVQQILQGMVDESWEYVPKMIETIFYHSNKDAAGYRNARVLTAAQTDVVQQLSNNLLGELTEASETAFKNVRSLYTIARLKEDPFRDTALKVVLSQEAAGSGWSKAATKMAQELQNKGITAFVDRAGRHWSLQSYGNMAVRTTARQAQVAAVLTADDYDLWQIVKIGSTCPVCAPLEGRVYSKSGTNPDYPPLSLAFGKIDPSGPDDLANTYLNIHPNCLHAIVKYTTVGKTEKQIQKDKDFSSPEKNPLNRDPRTKKQIAAYREKERARQRLLRDRRKKSIEKASSSGIIKLTDSEQYALNRYLSSESYTLNEALRRNAGKPSNLYTGWVRDLDRALDKMPEYKGVVYRSLSDFGIEDVDAFVKSYKVGDRKIFTSYLSCSEEVYDESFPIQYVIQSKYGKNILKYNQAEKEILFKRNSVFWVTKRDGNTIYLEEE